ncbi:MAG: diguanylate cyclase [Terracidiphilus sp.]|nr:diguanylate cyclase [Terracidiphilus sp.]
MPLSGSLFSRIAAIGLLALAGGSSRAQQASAKAVPIVIEGMGKGTVSLNGPCQFHLGDNPAWASPAFDSSDWEQLGLDKPWGKQGHARYTGFAWYRCTVEIVSTAASSVRFSLLVPRIDSAYQVYWNGSFVGENGKLPPHPVWFNTQPPQIFELGPVHKGVLAVRVWSAPLFSDDSGGVGGFAEAPLLGSSSEIATAAAALNYEWLRSQQALFGENLLYGVVGLLSFLLWCRNRGRRTVFWMAWFALVPPIDLLLLDAHIRWPYALTMGAVQPLAALRDVALWFLLVWLLPLHENRAILRLTRILAWISIANGAFDGVLIAINSRAEWTPYIQTADAASAAVYTVLGFVPVILAGYALLQRERLDTVSVRVASLAFVVEMFYVMSNALKQGRQFTGWSIADNIDSPVFTLGGSAISLPTLAGALLLVAIAYAVYHSMREDQRRQITLEREKIEWMRAKEQMRYNAEHDGLTGLWNHRVIVDRLRGEMNRALRDGTQLSVILIDLDYFKQINDTFGHLTGDYVLKEVAAIFQNSLRDYDWVGRYGGEEFLLILPGSDIESALNRAEQLRKAVESARIMDGEARLRVTASFGVASDFPPHFTAESVIRIVDSALYRAKNIGRNCVTTSEIDLALYQN